MKKADAMQVKSPPKRISEGTAKFGAWRGSMFVRVRKLIKEADPAITEERKWKKPTRPGGIPVWSHDGIVCTGEPYKDHVRLTFPKGASIDDPTGIFNSSLDSKAWRAVVIHQGDEINEAAFKNLIRAAVVLNSSAKKK